MYKNNIKIKNSRAGFSLFELIVVIAIVAVVTSITFNNFPKMNSKLSLDLLAQDIALTIRQAQVYGTTVLGSGDPSAGNSQFTSYGVSFPDPKAPYFTSGGNKYTYTLFADIDAGCGDDSVCRVKNSQAYNEGGEKCRLTDGFKTCLIGQPAGCFPSSGNECVERFSATGKDKVLAICYNYQMSDNFASNWRDCVNATAQLANGTVGKIDGGSSIDVVFTRPSLQASLMVRKGSVESYKPQNVAIVLANEDETEHRAVVVWANGQIAVDR